MLIKDSLLQPQSLTSKLLTYLNWLSLGTGCLLLFSVFATVFEESHWLLSLTVHFREWFILLAIALGFTSIWSQHGSKTLICISICTCFFHTYGTFPHWSAKFWSSSKTPLQQAELNVFFANVNSQNSQKDQLLKYLRQHQPDLVFLAETTSDWLTKIKTIEADYPYAQAIPQEGNFGMGVLSKTPLSVQNTFFDREHYIPALFLKTKRPQIGDLNIVLLHPFPPIGGYGTLLRDRYLETLSHHIQELKGSTLVCGDFNTTPWSMIFRKFMKVSELNLPHQHHSPNTWPTTSILPSLPIDHCLVKGLKVLAYKKGPNINSDHWPLILTVAKK